MTPEVVREKLGDIIFFPEFNKANPPMGDYANGHTTQFPPLKSVPNTEIYVDLYPGLNS